MTRCIHCTRCVRFATEVAGVPEIGAIGRGENMEITTYLEKSMESELSANVIDLCPVGALTSKPYAFEARPWELKKTESIDVMDAVGSNIRVDTYNWEVKRILPRLNNNINEEWISDKTRYSCDGLLKQRLDVPYIKKNNKLVKSNWDEAIGTIVEKIKKLNPEEIGGHIGDMISLESALGLKKLFKTFNCDNLEFREKRFYINPNEKINYIFNTSIKGIEDADFLLLIGTNPRLEATMLNARIRKTFVKKNIPIFSIGNPGDLTYDYQIAGTKTDEIKKFINKENDLSKKFLQSKKPVIIIGESALELKSGKYLFEKIKNFLRENNFITKDWNALNVLVQNASTVGLIDLKVIPDKKDDFIFFDKLNNKEFKLLYLLGSDNLEVKKNNEFIIYQGSHGDRGAEIADVILPNAAYTEQDGLYENLEGRVQECKKASYPIGDAKEDWKIFNLLIKNLDKKNETLQFEKLRKEVLDNIPGFNEINELPILEIQKENSELKSEFISEEIKIKDLNYYFSNSISRASKTMSQCHQERGKTIKTGTNN
tara:strand:- start:787 stop:2415 length:1629 start_codon:yes stop_codon:yes gene_type:complete